MRLRVLLAAAALPLVLWLSLPLVSSGQQLQQKIDSARSKIESKKGTERVLTTDIARWSSRIGQLQDRIGGLQARQNRIQSDLDRKRTELIQIQADLRDERARLARLRARLVVARRALSTRLREIYMADRPDALSVVLNSNGFADLLERGEFIQRIADQDRRIVGDVRDAKAESEATAARLDKLEKRQQRVTAQVLVQRNEVSRIRMELVGTKVGLERTRAGKRAALGKIRVDRRELESQLKALEAEQARVQAKLASAAGAPGAGPIRRGSGQLIWPVNGPITSPFGPRWGRLHAGLDIGAPNGTPIRAADAGRVVIAGWEGAYGNYTCIQHSASFATCYAHQSRIDVSTGQNVSQGQVIGAVGNTGRSFGAHVHFETRVNGTPANPLNYL